MKNRFASRIISVMTREKIRILITNDDGYHSDGIIALENALSEIGDCYVVAPASEMSGASHSLTLARPLRIRQIDERHWTVDGTPTDCVTLALNRILPPELRPHICASGINHGANLGDDATYSGTVAGALEATILGVPGLAFSLVANRKHDFTESAKVAKEMTEKAIRDGLPENTLLNINVPKNEPKGIRVTKQGFKNSRPVISANILIRAANRITGSAKSATVFTPAAARILKRLTKVSFPLRRCEPI